MKFRVKTVIQRGARLGELSDIHGQPDIVLETPLALLHTQGGHIPHITHEVLKLVTSEPQILQIPIVSMHSYQEVIRQFDGNVSDFIGNTKCVSYVTLHDPSTLTKQGHHVKDKVPVFTRSGKIMYDSEKYMDMIANFKPDMYTLLSDGDTNIASSNKRIIKSVDNTVAFHRQCLTLHKKHEGLKNAFIIAPIAGGYCLKLRQKCIDAMLPDNHLVQGYLIDGLHNNGPEVELISFEEMKPIIASVLSQLPSDKLKVVHGCWNPVNILKFVKCGVDVFDTSYCRILTERSAALIFAISADDETESYEINLRQSKFAYDFQPLLLGCQCVACKGYTRGYIHHLLSVQELLGSVLVMVHNVHHMLRFIQEIRDSIKRGSLDVLEDRINVQFKNFQCLSGAVLDTAR